MAEFKKVKKQFDLRSEDYNVSANWISDTDLIHAHVELGGEPKGEALDLCCGTGMIGRALQDAGWSVKGLDISEEMVRLSSVYFQVLEGSAENIPFESDAFQLVVCRQTFQFLDSLKVLSEITRVLAPGGILIIGLTVPFSDKDKGWLFEIHSVKQPLLKKFYTTENLVKELKDAGFDVKETRTIRVRESIFRWMRYAPELTEETKEKVISMVKNAPASYKELHRVEVLNGEVIEDWNWVVVKTSYQVT